MKEFINNLFFVKIWDYYHQHTIPLTASFLLGVSALTLSELGFNFVAVISIVISTFVYLYSYLKIPKVFGLFRGIFFYCCIMLIAIYCFNNIYIEYGIIYDNKTIKELSDTIYFSIVTWTTLGYGDFKPSEEARIWAATESMLGYIYMGLLVGLIISGLTPEKSRFSDKRPAKKYNEK